MCDGKYMETYLIIVQAVTAVLLVTSELLGLSKCKANGIVDFILNHYTCKQKQEIQTIDLREENDSEMPVIYQIQTTNPLVAKNVTYLAASDALCRLQMESRRDIARGHVSSEWSE